MTRSPNCIDAAFSPHAWGWTYISWLRHDLMTVFPTRVGVEPSLAIVHPVGKGFPHTRGGGLPSAGGALLRESFSPHAWGWTYFTTDFTFAKGVFPTRVGVD